MPVEITDPDLLRQLNGPQEVTDPDVLRMLNGESNPAPVTAMAPAAVDPDLGPIMAPGQTPVMPAAPTNPTGQQLPVTAQTPGAQAFWRGSGQGVTLGAGDELSAGADALRGGNYDHLLAASREANATAQKEHPWAYGTGQVVGGLAGFVPMMAAGPAAAGARVAVPLVSRMGTGAMVGAGLGAVQGFNEGEGGFLNRGGNAVSGAVTGGGIGGLAPAAGAALGSAVQAGVNQLALRGTAIPGMGSRASNTLGEFYNASPAGRIESNIANLGPDAMLADASPAF